jgi:hypothetical protein
MNTNTFEFLVDRENQEDLKQLQIIAGIRYAFTRTGAWLFYDGQTQINKDPLIDGTIIRVSKIQDTISTEIIKPKYLKLNTELETEDYNLLI